MSEYVAETRFKLEEAKFFYEQMKLNFQNRKIFLYYLDAFLSTARTVTLVFQKARGKVEESLMKWYNSKTDEWKNNSLMKFFIEMRNVSVKEYTPKMQTTAVVGFPITVTIGDSLTIKKVSSDGKEEQTTPPVSEQYKEKQQTTSLVPKVVSYSFHELPRGFNDNPDVMCLCKKYLDILEKFVMEAEDMIGMKK